MGKAERAGRTHEDTAFHQTTVRPKDRTLDTESGSFSERDNCGDESIPPARVMPAGGTLTAGRQRLHLDTMGEMTDVTVLVAESINDYKIRSYHLPSNVAGERPHCKQPGNYERWSFVKAETHQRLRLCDHCWNVDRNTLTVEGEFTHHEKQTLLCPNCSEDVTENQIDTHIKEHHSEECQSGRKNGRLSESWR